MDEEGRPLLCDFGRSRIVGVDGFDTTLTSSQHYTAPELLNSEDEIVPLTKPSDIFSLSVTLLRVRLALIFEACQCSADLKVQQR